MIGPSALPATRYAKSGNVHVAYQAFGEGPIGFIFFPGFVSNIEVYWEEPSFAQWLRKLGRFSRVIMFDKRGTGLSDRLERLPTMDERMDDVRAVMDAAESKRAAVFGLSEGGSLATLFAAHYPERCQALVLWGAFARFNSWFPTLERLNGFLITWRPSGAPARTSSPGPRPRRTIRFSETGLRNESVQARARPPPRP
jgi:pimeloyl-ACP methyl ester carboxylesterase